jgi:Helicase HerA, central domain
MDESERRALAALRFNWAPTPDDVWRSTRYHVDGLHRDVMRMVLEGVGEAWDHVESSPVGVVVLGQRGSGKTHLLGSVRERVQADGGYFFLVSVMEASAFWGSLALSMLDGFSREPDGDASQLRVFLRRLADTIDAPRVVRRAMTGESESDLSRPALDAVVDLLRKADRQVGTECQDTARALVLYASESAAHQNIGYDFLCSNDEVEPGERAGWGMRRGKRSAQEIVRDISRLLALTGPTVIAVDQIDVLVAQWAKSTAGDVREEWRTALLLEQIAGGLMHLRDTTRRTLSVVSCLPVTWEQIKTQVTDTVQDRFREAAYLADIPSAEIGQELIAKRFATKFAEVGFAPPYPTWPVSPRAFADAHQFTPRELLRAVDSHVRACLAADEVREMTSLLQRTPEPSPAARRAESQPDTTGFTGFDATFAALVAQADPAGALHERTEDAEMPALIEAGLIAWIAERGEAGEAYNYDPQPGGKPALHARLRRTFGDETEDEEHWAFRAISSKHHISALNRIRNAVTAAGLTEGVSRRKLFLLRNPEFSSGARTREVLAAFEKAGGARLRFGDRDVQILIALQGMIKRYGYETLQPWFASRRPTREIEFLSAALAGADAGEAAPRVNPAPAAATPAPEPTAPAVVDERRITLGVGLDHGGPVTIDLEALRRHTAIFAGSGSGKTVLIRRLVEECALRGVSAIVLDPNNDLARLGEPWPTPPGHWDDAEIARAAEYQANTEVVIWTPRRESGRPLAFQPLPDFAGILDDPDAFAAAVDAAAAALAPRAKVDGSTGKAAKGQAVLREALTYYARTGASDLRGFVELLNVLPEGVSALDGADKMGAEMAQLLKATMVNDPLFGGGGTPVDPGVLLTPGSGRRARVSVISLIGLPDDEQRQSFVNQLQLALFAWIKRNPAGDRPLGGLLVMDEAQTLAPSGALTACTQSTLALASQARKYGLGLVFATQAPKGLHNRVTGNAATQLFGLLNHPTHIGAARELARAKGSDIADVGRLRIGQFYAAIEGAEFQKLQAPLCLTHHPKSPLTPEEIIERARV